MNDLTNVIAQARAAGLTAVYHTATTMAANGRYTLLTRPGRDPQVICNPTAVQALVAAMNEAGIKCEELRMEGAKVG